MMLPITGPARDTVILSPDQASAYSAKAQINPKYKFKIFNCRFGRGCFAAGEIKGGETICFFEGEEISWTEFHKRFLQGRIRVDDPLQLSDNKYMELYPPYICFNHSCNPNAGFRGKTELVAIRNIMPGEEIYYDYSTVSWDDRWSGVYGAWTMKCDCGEENCRKLIGDFPTITPVQMKRYMELGLIPDFILEKLAREEEKTTAVSLSVE